MIEKVFKPRWQSEGQGAKVKRAIGTPALRNLDPFLMLDNFKVKLPDGFPDHPHRGFETVTYMLDGELCHEDFGGHSGKIGPGDIQWMTAGKGIMHAEMPTSYDQYAIGFQLWINLPSNKKMINPKYQEFTSDQLPIFTSSTGTKVKVIAGQYEDHFAKIIPESTSCFYDIELGPGSSLSQKIFEGWQGLVFPYVFSGVQESENFTVGGQILVKDEVAQFVGDGSDLVVKNDGSDTIVKFILLYGKPIGEQISKSGPFVMNTQEELYQTYEDYEMAKNGFERRKNWSSVISKLNQSF